MRKGSKSGAPAEIGSYHMYEIRNSKKRLKIAGQKLFNILISYLDSRLLLFDKIKHLCLGTGWRDKYQVNLLWP